MFFYSVIKCNQVLVPQYMQTAIWTLFGIVAILKFNFDYLMIAIIALTMCVSNIIGFTKCHKGMCFESYFDGILFSYSNGFTLFIN